MPEAVVGLRQILGDEAGGRMAVIADRHRAMSRLHPSTVVVLHDMAIGTGVWVIRQVRVTLRVNKRIESEPDRQSNQDSENDGCPGSDLHLGEMRCLVSKPSATGFSHARSKRASYYQLAVVDDDLVSG